MCYVWVMCYVYVMCYVCVMCSVYVRFCSNGSKKGPKTDKNVRRLWATFSGLKFRKTWKTHFSHKTSEKDVCTPRRISPFLWSQNLEDFCFDAFLQKIGLEAILTCKFSGTFGRNASKAFRTKDCERNSEKCVEKL